MAITDGTQTTTPQVPNTPPEIKLNLNFDEKATPNEVVKTEVPAEKSETGAPEHILLTGMHQEETSPQAVSPQEGEAPMFLKIDTPLETKTPEEVAPIQDIQSNLTTENTVSSEAIPAQEPEQAADAWLAQEDALVQKTEEISIPKGVEAQTVQATPPPETNPLERSEPAPSVATPIIAEPKEGTTGVSDPSTEKSIQTSTPEVSIPTSTVEEKPEQIEMSTTGTIPANTTVAENIPQMSLQEDMKIIRDLGSQETAKQEAPTQATPTVQETQTNTLNLDTLLQNATLAPQQTPVSEQAVPTNIPVVAQTQTSTVPFMTEEKKTKGTKILLFVLLFVSLGAVAFFIFKTMFPVEYAGIISFPTGQTQVTPIEAPLLTSGDILGTEIISGDIIGGDVLSGTIASGVDISGQHGSADDTMFSDLQDLGSEGPSTDTLISKLQSFAEKGSTIFDAAKIANDKIGMKFGGYIRNKATTLANSLASGEQLDTQMVQNYLAQFSGYLSQLQPATNETNIQGPTEISPSLSGGTPELAPPTAPIENSGFTDNTNNIKSQ